MRLVSGCRHSVKGSSMATTNGGPGGVQAGGDAQAPDQAQPTVNVVAQYIKDFSFENPNAPRSFAPTQQPAISIQINVAPKPVSETDFEVELKLEGKAEATGMLLFSFDLA